MIIKQPDETVTIGWLSSMNAKIAFKQLNCFGIMKHIEPL